MAIDWEQAAAVSGAVGGVAGVIAVIRTIFGLPARVTKIERVMFDDHGEVRLLSHDDHDDLQVRCQGHVMSEVGHLAKEQEKLASFQKESRDDIRDVHKKLDALILTLASKKEKP
jgi:hypothetical protein